MRAGKLVVDVQAGTSKFVLDMEKAKGKIREFGATGVSETKATRAAFKALEGGMLDNKRAAEQFAEKLLGLGGLAKVAFPILGGLAFAGMLVEVGKKVSDFFKELHAGPEKSRAAFYALRQSLHTTNDELDLTNAKLQNDILKLEGKRQNNLAVALMEVKVAADKLGESIDKDITSLNKLFKEQDVSWIKSLFGGGVSNKELQKYFGGESGVGGMFGRLEKLNTDEQTALSKTNTEAQAKAISDTFNKRRQAELDEGRKKISEALKNAQNPSYTEYDMYGVARNVKGTPNQKNIEELQHDLAAYEQIVHHYQSLNTNAELTGEKSKLEINKANEKLTKPIEDRINELKAQLKGIQELSKAVGGTEAEQVQAKATAAYEKTIEQLNKALGDHKNLLGAVQLVQIKSLETRIAQAEADKASKTHFDELNKSIQERILAQKELAAAVGQSYESARAAFVQTQVAAATKEHANDSAWKTKWSGNIAGLGTEYGQEYDALHGTQTATALQSLHDHIALETKLGAAYSLGAEAVHQAEMAQRALELSRTHTVAQTKQILDAEEQLYQAQKKANAAKQIDTLNQQTQGANRVSGAVWGGSEAERQAAAMNKLRQMRHEGATDAQLEAEANKDDAEHRLLIEKEAEQTVYYYRDQLQHLEQIRASIEHQKEVNGDSLEIEAALKQLEIDRLHILVEQELKLGGAKNQLKAFFDEMNAQSKKASTVLYDGLNSAVDGVSDQLANLFTGQKTNFGQMFKDIGHQMVQQSIKEGLKKGLGAIGKHFNISGLEKLAGVGKKDGQSEESALWVQFKQQQGQAGLNTSGILNGIPVWGATGAAGIGAMSSGIGALSSTGSELIPAVTSSIAFLAGGGDVNPYSSYVVGEHEPELFTPRTSGMVTPLSKISGGGGNQYYTIDARGAELGTENRISRAIELSHQSAISNSVRANQQRANRTPQRKN